MCRYVSEDIPTKPVNGWMEVSPSPGDNPEKKLIWGYISAAYILAVKLDTYKEQYSKNNICTNYGCEIIPAVFRLCKKAVSLAMTYYYENHLTIGFKYPSYVAGWNTIRCHLDVGDCPEELEELMLVFDTVNENNLIRDGKTRYANYETLCGDTRRIVSLILTRAI
ncbi:MAG: hypothetical protein UGF89_02405 [Acutalibacteraceae bacterium]|nr:hypothetical protein [Acutalibacteraceae bacterium]